MSPCRTLIHVGQRIHLPIGSNLKYRCYIDIDIGT